MAFELLVNFNEFWSRLRADVARAREPHRERREVLAARDTDRRARAARWRDAAFRRRR